MATTYTKLRSGEWGVKVNGAAKVGDRVTVTKKDGGTKVETIAQVVFSGNGVTLCAIRRDASPARASGKKQCATGGNCSSFGSGKSCGADDCDGW